MDYNGRKRIPYIPPAEYDKVAREFLEQFYPDALQNSMPVPIEEIAKTGLCSVYLSIRRTGYLWDDNLY